MTDNDSLGFALAVRRITKSTMVHLCDLSSPDRLALMSARFWVDWKAEVAANQLRPERDGDRITIEILDPTVGKAPQRVFTTVSAYKAFQEAARDGRFDGLSPVLSGHKHGPWIWAGGILLQDAKTLDGVT